MMRSVVRGVLGILFAALATWAANYIIEKMFGPEESEETLA